MFRNNINEVEIYLNKKYEFKINEISKELLFRKIVKKSELDFSLLEDYELNSIMNKLRKLNLNISATSLREILFSDFTPQFNPFKVYFENLPEWDGTDYILQLAETVKTTNTGYFQWCLKKWIVALVAGLLNKSEVNQWVLIFCGSQGVGKSTWFEKLLPNELQLYFCEKNIVPDNKDDIKLLSEKAIICMDELAGFNKYNVEKYKQLITQKVVTQRLAYDRFNQSFTRIASFAGTSNKSTILHDLTGNRRYLCNEVLEIDFKHKIDMNMVYAQAYNLYKNDFKYFFDADDSVKVENQNQNFMSTTQELDWINECFGLPDGKNKVVHMNASEIQKYLKTQFKVNNIAGVEIIGKIVSDLGFKKKTKYRKYELVLKNEIDKQ